MSCQVKGSRLLVQEEDRTTNTPGVEDPHRAGFREIKFEEKRNNGFGWGMEWKTEQRKDTMHPEMDRGRIPCAVEVTGKYVVWDEITAARSSSVVIFRLGSALKPWLRPDFVPYKWDIGGHSSETTRKWKSHVNGEIRVYPRSSIAYVDDQRTFMSSTICFGDLRGISLVVQLNGLEKVFVFRGRPFLGTDNNEYNKGIYLHHDRTNEANFLSHSR
ncbi:hypothetical protein B0H16DRAFT_1696403 [Mycena metata]|uniref:Uncharacterized protein n=1 Tax=Mycena metata TaxID=1033252 RepID=A0AAD7I2H2_9AGAR|nr:hypothetical protein B0H16DRAFT_1696403 [Mycena metata]